MRIDEAKILAATSLLRQMNADQVLAHLSDAEFKVFSQFGDDGIIQYLLRQLDIPCHTFIEFGVQNYTEANTRFLLMHDNWTGLVIDGSVDNIAAIKRDAIYWKHDLTAVHAFVTKANINDIFRTHRFTGEIGLLSIDIDGNDYWVWEAIEVVAPIIVVAEYNSTFGKNHALTVPYDPVFTREKAHYSCLFWGCSLKALCLLAERKGYDFVGSNSVGNNAFFVRTDKIGNLKPLTAEAGYVPSKFRDSRDQEGQLSFIGGDDRIQVIRDMQVYDVERGALVTIQDLGERLVS